MATYEADDRPERLDIDAIWAFLSTEAYWHRWRTREDVESQIESAWRVVGIYVKETGEQVAFARTISDGISDAYLADVYVHADHRGLGLGKQLMSVMVDKGPGSRMRWFLTTRDAHGLYEQFGFAKPDERMLVRPSTLVNEPRT
jgi:GNAT superfamily N-acetyltransferase